jgi:glycosyltransferase involved in cell wall biosynthesis
VTSLLASDSFSPSVASFLISGSTLPSRPRNVSACAWSVAGDGPARARLERVAGPQTEFVGEVSEDQAADLLSRCAAFVFCAEEDFGIAPVEANAHGAPVVAFARGGAAETLENDRTAVFFHEQKTGAVATAIEHCLGRTWDADVLRRNAARFSPEHFRDGMRAQLRAALEARHA